MDDTGLEFKTSREICEIWCNSQRFFRILQLFTAICASHVIPLHRARGILMGKWGRWFSKETELKSYETGIQVSLHPAASSPITFNRLTNSETHKGLAEWRRGKEHYKMNGKLGISVAEAARRLGISTRTAYTWARRADFPSFRIGNRIVVYEKGLEEWMKKMMETKAA